VTDFEGIGEVYLDLVSNGSGAIGTLEDVGICLGGSGRAGARSGYRGSRAPAGPKGGAAGSACGTPGNGKRSAEGYVKRAFRSVNGEGGGGEGGTNWKRSLTRAITIPDKLSITTKSLVNELVVVAGAVIAVASTYVNNKSVIKILANPVAS
jgi:hypothetical protein